MPSTRARRRRAVSTASRGLSVDGARGMMMADLTSCVTSYSLVCFFYPSFLLAVLAFAFTPATHSFTPSHYVFTSTCIGPHPDLKIEQPFLYLLARSFGGLFSMRHNTSLARGQSTHERRTVAPLRLRLRRLVLLILSCLYSYSPRYAADEVQMIILRGTSWRRRDSR